MKKTLIFLSILFMFMAPALSLVHADIKSTNNGLVPCGTVTSAITKDATTGVETGGVVTNPCGFNDVIILINNIIFFIIFYLAIPICAIMFAYAGFLLVTAGGEAAGARTKAKTIFLHAALGLVIAVAAWLIVKTILSIVEYKWIGDFFG